MDLKFIEHRRSYETLLPSINKHFNQGQNSPLPPINKFKSMGSESHIQEYYLNDVQPSDQKKRKATHWSQTSKIKGLEELGIFSEVNYSKKNFQNYDKTPKSKIYITDFMNQEQKFRLSQILGGCKAKGNRKETAEKEVSEKRMEFNQIFCCSERPQVLFNTPPNKRKMQKKLSGDIKLVQWSDDRTFKIDQIIEECGKVIRPRVLKKLSLC